jgi:hypothetical protein
LFASKLYNLYSSLLSLRVYCVCIALKNNNFHIFAPVNIAFATVNILFAPVNIVFAPVDIAFAPVNIAEIINVAPVNIAFAPVNIVNVF